MANDTDTVMTVEDNRFQMQRKTGKLRIYVSTAAVSTTKVTVHCRYHVGLSKTRAQLSQRDRAAG